MSIKWLLRNLCVGLLLLSAVSVSGCASGPSHFTRSHNITYEFENFRIMPGHTYYYSGPSYGPLAVVALKDGYTLKSPHWQVIEMDVPKLRELVEPMLNHPEVFPNRPIDQGAYILNNQGEIIGGWYSIYQFPILKFITDTEIYISEPMTIVIGPNREIS